MKIILKILTAELKVISLVALLLILFISGQSISGIMGTSTSFVPQVLNMAFSYAIVCFFIFFVHKVYKHPLAPYSIDKNVKKNSKLYIFGLIIGLIVCMFAVGIPYFNCYSITKNNNFMIVYFIIGVIFTFSQAMVEEIIYRVFVITEFSKFNNKKILILGIVLSSFVFAMSHNGNPGFNELTFIAYSSVSIALCVLYLATKNMWFVGGIHAGWNIITAYVLSFMSATDNPTEKIIYMVTNKAGNFTELFGVKMSIYTVDSITNLIGAAILLVIGIILISNNKKKAIK